MGHNNGAFDGILQKSPVYLECRSIFDRHASTVDYTLHRANERQTQKLFIHNYFSIQQILALKKHSHYMVLTRHGINAWLEI